MEIACNRLDRGYQRYQKELEDKAVQVLRSGWYVLGRETEAFEKEFSAANGSQYCIGVASGLDALIIGFHLLGIGEGDEVLVQGNTYIASVLGITKNGAVPVFVDPDLFYNIDTTDLEKKITARTKAILAVHLYGQASDMERIMQIAEQYGLTVLEDCAQSHGAGFRGKKTGSFGKIGCFSFYPTKNLGAFGDGGAIVTDSAEIADKARIYRNYGSDIKYHNKVCGINSRLDELQAGLLRVKLRHLGELTKERQYICGLYTSKIKNEYIDLPGLREGADSVWHQYVIRTDRRKQLQDFLLLHGIQTMIHYPIPPHCSEAYKYLGISRGSLPVTEKYADEVLSLPLYNGMTMKELDYVIDILNQFCVE